jgi:hypothetical protein
MRAAATIAMTTNRVPARRRGVLLLVVLSMLTLFLLLGTTYVILAARARSTAKAFRSLAVSQTQFSTTWQPALQDAALEVIRGSQNPRSAIGPYNLLADKYGGSQTYSVIGAVLPVAAGQLLRLRIQEPDVPFNLCGRVLSFKDGPVGVAGTSCRIVQAARASAGECFVYVMRPRLLGANISPAITQVRINGRDFAGTGSNRTSGNLQQPDLTDRALKPDTRFDSVTGALGPTDVNEDYDAVDEQNMALASPDGFVASFHRKDIVDHWVRTFATRVGVTLDQAQKDLASLLHRQFLGGGAGSADERAALLYIRQAMLRPFPFDHVDDPVSRNYDFTGRPLRDTGLNALNGNDVDTDGDGVLDSVWLDLGWNPVTMSDGTRVKPLFAIRCVDLQGRLNVNVHGSPVHPSAETTTDARLAARQSTQAALDPKKTYPPPMGQGAGTADVRIEAVVGPGLSRTALVGLDAAQGTISGIERSMGPVFGRYGDAVGSADSFPRPGRPGVNDDRVATDGTTQLPERLWRGPRLAAGFDFWKRNPTNEERSAFAGQPPDMWSRYAVAIDHRGHPLFLNRVPAVSLFEMVDNPYEFVPDRFPNPHGGATAAANAWLDQPFTPAEFEALLRPFDADNASALPQRMISMMVAAAAGRTQDFALLRNAVTTISWDTPLVTVRAPDGPAWDALKHDWDLVRGLKMNLNRPFGDGKDNNANGVVDDAGEGNRPNDADQPAGSDGYAVPVPPPSGSDSLPGWRLTRGALPKGFDDLDQPGPNVATLRARQLYAYHIFQLLKSLATKYAFFFPNASTKETEIDPTMKDPGSRLFAIERDDPDETEDDRKKPPEARDAALAKDAADPKKTVGDQEAHTDRVLAQWAVNIVDFLDADAIMTPFRYSKVDGSQTADPALKKQFKPWTRHVVWGCEYPDLMITETLAFHDRGVADTDKDDGPKKTTQRTDVPGSIPDSDFDQVRLPQGSLFVELYATRSPNIPNPPAELYRWQGNNWVLDVGKMAPENKALKWQAPVWRLSIARRTLTSGTLKNDPFAVLAKYPDTEWLMPHGPSAIGGDTAVEKPAADRPDASSPAVIRTDRYVWLSGASPPVKADAKIDDDDGYPNIDNTFYIQSGTSPVVARGGYLVIGPRQTTRLGSAAFTGDDGGEAPPTGQRFGIPSPQRIELGANAVNVFPLDGAPTTTAAATAIVAADSPAGWTMPGVGQSGIGLSVSEPLRDSYYPQPPVRNEITGIYDLFDPNSLPNAPFDERSGLAGNLNGDGPPDRAVPQAPAEGTVSNFATVVLERLADPLRPHDPRPEKLNTMSGVDEVNPDWNPYIPVDFQPVDLTIFAGESAAAAVSPRLAPPRPYRFYTRQRGFGSDLEKFDVEATLSGTGDIVRNLNPWKPIGSNGDLDFSTVHKLPTTQNTQAATRAYFKHELNQLQRQEPTAWKETPYHSLGSLNASYGRPLRADEVPAGYAGSPDMPFPSITWNDSPFANAYELVLVPRTAPSRLFTNFRPLDLTNVPGASRTGEGTYATATLPDDIFGGQCPGAHLFPLTSLTDRPIGNGRYSRNADVFGNIFEFVRVPSPFSCATVTIDPDGWAAGADDPEGFFKAPFNQIPLYREPGGVNLNTIPRGSPENPAPAGMNTVGQQVWDGIRGVVLPADGQSPAPSLSSLSDSRRIDTGNDVFYRLPFRSIRGSRHDLTKGAAAANGFIPAGRLPNLANLDGQLAPRNFTLFGDALDKNASLFAPVLHPPADSSNSDPSRDPRLHPWFAFQPLIRTAAASTVRSETYAIWVTMGLFEVQESPAYTWYDPVTGNPAAVGAGSTGSNHLFPDGLRLVREHGGETGEIVRYRAFYIYDRSIPVEYAIGEDNNVDQGILIERFIE